MDQSATVSIWYDYFCLKMNKVKWTRSLGDLKAFLFTELREKNAANSSWRSPSGGTWVFESDQLKVTWHSKSENINFEGARSKDLADQITSLLTRVDDEQVKANSVEAESVKSIEINEVGDKSDLSVNICVNEAITTVVGMPGYLHNFFFHFFKKKPHPLLTQVPSTYSILWLTISYKHIYRKCINKCIKN